MKRYVCGFLFTSNRRSVALIRKARPTWQSGLLNGIGGKIEEDPGESPHEAMSREFLEETGHLIEPVQWSMFAKITQTAREDTNEHWLVYFFRSFLHHNHEVKLEGSIDEPVRWCEVATLQQKFATVPNLAWLIPFSLEDITGEMQQIQWSHKE